MNADRSREQTTPAALREFPTRRPFIRRVFSAAAVDAMIALFLGSLVGTPRTPSLVWLVLLTWLAFLAPAALITWLIRRLGWNSRFDLPLTVVGSFAVMFLIAGTILALAGL